MAVRFSLGGPTIESRPKKTRQGKSVNTILAPTSRNKRKKKYRVGIKINVNLNYESTIL